MDTFVIQPKGPFSLEEAARFTFGPRQGTDFDGTMRLAFCVDGYRDQAAVAVTQAPDGSVLGTIWGVATPAGPAGGAGTETTAAVVAQVARVLSIDHDANGYQAMGDQDPVIARLLATAPGLRPPLFYSPYEAALWAVISMRRSGATARRWRERLAQSAGAGFEVAGSEMWAVPTPEAIIDLGPEGVAAATGVELPRAQRVVGVAQAAQAGKLEAATIAGRSEDEARAALRQIPGIGPFYADLIVVRATGATDVFPLNEPRLLALMGQLYGRPGPMTPKQGEAQAEAWRPWRTWIAVLFRSAGPRLLGTAPKPNRGAKPRAPKR
jgi:DNA-3-methyladenine glycosylase II